MNELPLLVAQLVERRLAGIHRRPPPDGAFAERWPNLFALATTDVTDGARTHEAATLGLRLGDGSWVASVSIGYLAQSTSAEGPTHEQAFDRLETAIATGEARWGVWKGRQPLIKAPAEPRPNGQNGRKGGGKGRRR